MVRLSKRLKREKVEEVKVARQCEDTTCRGDGGYPFTAVELDFDHVRGEKTAAVSQLIGAGVGWAMIEDEIAKCDVVCVLCHRRRHLGLKKLMEALEP